MIPDFIGNHLWQSSCFAALAGLLAFLLRKNPPKVRYWVWLSASLKFLAPWALLVILGDVVQWPVQRAVSVSVPVFTGTLIQIAEPFSPPAYALVPVHASLPWMQFAIGILWALGFFSITLVRCRSWLRIRATLRASTPVELPIGVPALLAPRAAEPGIVGFLRPALILPAQLLEHLNRRQLDAILAHENVSRRRRDNFFAAVHMGVEAIFWFHPLVWWIGSRMVEERELACAEEVLRMGCEPADYVRGILKVCRHYTESPLQCVSGVTGADIKKRLRAILAGRVSRELNLSRKLVLALAAVAAVAAPITVGVLDAPAMRAQAQSSVRSATAPRPSFEVASIRRCSEPDLADSAASGDGRGGGGAVGRNTGDAGRLRLGCRTVQMLIVQAYLRFASGAAKPLVFGAGLPPIQDGPAWIETERYTINAKPESAQSMAMMAGPMLQALLEDRFKLKVHHGSKEVPAWALVIAKGGPRLRPAKDCPVKPPAPPLPLGPGQTPPCNYQRFTDSGMDTYGWTMANLSDVLGSHVRRTVIDKTGIRGAFDFHMDLPMPPPPDQHGADDPGATDPLGAVMDSLKKLGLKLEPVKGTAEFVVIDHVERPSEN
jgi:bla regulator protein BlaR1